MFFFIYKIICQSCMTMALKHFLSFTILCNHLPFANLFFCAINLIKLFPDLSLLSLILTALKFSKTSFTHYQFKKCHLSLSDVSYSPEQHGRYLHLTYSQYFVSSLSHIREESVQHSSLYKRSAIT